MGRCQVGNYENLQEKLPEKHGSCGKDGMWDDREFEINWLCTPYRTSSGKRPYHDRERSATQTKPLIAASFRTWRGSWSFVTQRPVWMAGFRAKTL